MHDIVEDGTGPGKGWVWWNVEAQPIQRDLQEEPKFRSFIKSSRPKLVHGERATTRAGRWRIMRTA